MVFFLYAYDVVFNIPYIPLYRARSSNIEAKLQIRIVLSYIQKRWVDILVNLTLKYYQLFKKKTFKSVHF